jgi:hypothetical protein
MTLCTSQSPAVRDLLVQFVTVAVVNEVLVVVAGAGYSPTVPALAVLFVVVPATDPVKPPPATTEPATNTLFPTPTPPVTTSAPLVLPLDVVAFVMVTKPVAVNPAVVTVPVNVGDARDA